LHLLRLRLEVKHRRRWLAYALSADQMVTVANNWRGG
jgi:hypothetical protein